jgi:hypothetical protein
VVRVSICAAYKFYVNSLGFIALFLSYTVAHWLSFALRDCWVLGNNIHDLSVGDLAELHEFVIKEIMSIENDHTGVVGMLREDWEMSRCNND